MDRQSIPVQKASHPPKRFLRFAQMQSLVGLSRSSIYARIQEGSFPRSISLGGKAVAWLESDIEGWITAQIATTDQANAK